MDAARTEIEREWNENPSFCCVAPPAWRRDARELAKHDVGAALEAAHAHRLGTGVKMVEAT
jgi:hypothetical protein